MGILFDKDDNKTVPAAPGIDAPIPLPICVIDAQQDSDEPTEEDLLNLRHTGGKIESAAWLAALFSGAERFAFYALQAPLRKQSSFAH